MTFTFFVAGRAAPQGSKKHVGRGMLVEMSKHLPAWRTSVVAAARSAQVGVGSTAEAHTFTPLDGPLLMLVEFWIDRPASHPKTKRTYPIGPPDLDKLLRAVGDALTQSGTIRDDSRIVAISTSERFVPTDARHAREGDSAVPGALIRVLSYTPEVEDALDVAHAELARLG